MFFNIFICIRFYYTMFIQDCRTVMPNFIWVFPVFQATKMSFFLAFSLAFHAHCFLTVALQPPAAFAFKPRFILTEKSAAGCDVTRCQTECGGKHLLLTSCVPRLSEGPSLQISPCLHDPRRGGSHAAPLSTLTNLEPTDTAAQPWWGRLFRLGTF